jgi:hypothetical protein
MFGGIQGIDDDGDFGSGISVHIISMGRSAQRFPFEQSEGIESNHPAFTNGQYERERFVRRNKEYMEDRDHVEIEGHELSDNRGYIQTPSSPYFPNFY